MADAKTPRPTDAELDILQVLWRLGPATVRQVHEKLLPARAIGYTTVLKLMQIMVEKKLLRRDESQRSHVYRPRASEEQTQRQLVRHLLNKAFQGSAAKLVLRALSSRPASPEELEEIRTLLSKLEERP